MKMNVLVPSVILAMGLTSASVYAADAGSGQITFTGSIIDAPCSINPDASNQEVDLGQIAASQLDKSGVSTPRNFSLVLENCSLASDEEESRATAASSVTVKFGGSRAVEDKDTWFGITGSADGAGVVITDGSGTIIPVGGSSAARDLIEGTNTLAFSAYLQGLGSKVQTGNFYSVADFTLTYE